MLGSLETHVMLAVLRGGGSAYGVSIADELQTRTGRKHSLGAIYTTLTRLIAKGFVEARAGEATPERGGRAKQHFRLTASGHGTLDASLAEISSLKRGLKISSGVIVR